MMPEAARPVGDMLAKRLEQRRSASAHGPLVLGLCGPQGSGKSTIARILSQRFAHTALLSLDDLYKTRAARAAMARDVHPLFATRGAPGTHDVELGERLIAALDRGEAAALPRFDKASDDRADPSDWPSSPAPCELLILEGWCVGARPQEEAELAHPVNALERDEDPAGIWRRHANRALADYQPLFARIDMLALLAPPSFDTVLGWRTEQEHRLRESGAAGAGVMDDVQVARFVAHYERLTRHILHEMPGRADMTVGLDADRHVTGVQCRAVSSV